MAIAPNTAAGEQLVAYVSRMENLLDEIEGLQGDLKDLKAEIKNEGYNVRALTKLVAIRRNKKKADLEAELLNDLMLYAHATGTLFDVTLEEPAPPPVELAQVRAPAGRADPAAPSLAEEDG